ncbi:SDR family oxidoreductase [Actinoplanes sp. LDG1-06]|uniref:SDR family oxidoreductase n=1 Tax=Paractinoplanes ovalisporus TaxID=2810368 RepID=A0ABS2AIN6_9ACTN|nr:SDR family oxidoreductase [Actinoplanes ovalisporus]MBM2619655.1 SDR family oxidoreductase [Actinoplanes ovalisporus]
MPAPTALITGGTTGIGRATADLLHERGYRVMVTGQNPDTLAEARDHFPHDVAVVRADARSLPDADAVVAAAEERFGSLDVLFLNAGISRPAPLEAVDEAFFDEVFAVNAKGQFFMLQKAQPLLADHASVVFTIGIGVSLGIAGGSVTAASRGALLSMVPSLALELAPRRIRVNAVSPGATDTPIWAKSGMPPEMLASVTASMAERIPFGRLGTAREVAETVAFLASPGASYITGQHLAVGGGSGLGA